MSSTYPSVELPESRLPAYSGVHRNREPAAADVRPMNEGSAADEAELLAAFQAGDAQAFGLLVHRYQDRLYSALMRFLNRSEDALDILQETFLSAFANARSFKGHARFYTWIYRIAMNHAIDLHRRKKPRHSLSLYSDDQADMTDPKSEAQPIQRLERDEDRHLLQRALQLLSPEHRIVLVMKEIDSLRYEEIAEALDVPVGTVRSRLHRARSELKDILEKLQVST